MLFYSYYIPVWHHDYLGRCIFLFMPGTAHEKGNADAEQRKIGKRNKK